MPTAQPQHLRTPLQTQGGERSRKQSDPAGRRRTPGRPEPPVPRRHFTARYGTAGYRLTASPAPPLTFPFASPLAPAPAPPAAGSSPRPRSPAGPAARPGTPPAGGGGRRGGGPGGANFPHKPSFRATRAAPAAPPGTCRRRRPAAPGGAEGRYGRCGHRPRADQGEQVRSARPRNRPRRLPLPSLGWAGGAGLRRARPPVRLRPLAEPQAGTSPLSPHAQPDLNSQLRLHSDSFGPFRRFRKGERERRGGG